MFDIFTVCIVGFPGRFFEFTVGPVIETVHAIIYEPVLLSTNTNIIFLLHVWCETVYICICKGSLIRDYYC